MKNKYIQVLMENDSEVRQKMLIRSRNRFTHREDVKLTCLRIAYVEKYGPQKISDLINRLSFKRAPQDIILNYGNKKYEIKMQLVEIIQVPNTIIYRYMVI